MIVAPLLFREEFKLNVFDVEVDDSVIEEGVRIESLNVVVCDGHCSCSRAGLVQEVK